MWIKPSNATTQGIHMKYNKAKIVKGYEHKLSNPKQFTRNLLSGKRWTSSWTCDSFQLTDKHQYTLKTTISHPPVLEDRRRWIEWKSHFHVKTELYITTPPTRAASHPSQHLVKKKKKNYTSSNENKNETNKQNNCCYSRLSLNGHLSKTDTYGLFLPFPLLPLFDSLWDGRLSKKNT